MKNADSVAYVEYKYYNYASKKKYFSDYAEAKKFFFHLAFNVKAVKKTELRRL